MLGAAFALNLGLATGCLLTLVWLVTLLRFHRAGRDFPELHAGSYPGPVEDAPLVSVIVAAKDEEESIGACARSLLAQDHPSFELVFVNDRSVDRTGEVLEELAREHPSRLRVLTVEELPAGWGGQSHALSRGVEASRGEWICFTDADCELDSTRALSMAWRDCTEHGADLFSMLPRMATPTAWERVYLPLCSFMILIRLGIAEVNRPQADAGYANGAFLMIRRSSYDALGGHAAVRGFVNDDVRLAQLAKRAGLKLWVTANLDLCRTRMYGSIPGAWRGWSRNFYGTLQTATALLAALGETLTLFVLPWLGLGTALALGPEWRSVAAAWAAPVALSHLGLWRLYRAYGIHAAWSLFYVPGATFVAAILANAAQRSLRKAGTTWHGVRYEHPEPLSSPLE